MRKYYMGNSQVNRAKRQLARDGRATLRSGLGLIPKLGTAIGIYDTANGAAKTARAAVRYGDALKRQATARVNQRIRTVTNPIRHGIRGNKQATWLRVSPRSLWA